MQLVNKIEQFIRESLRHRYDTRSPLTTFLERKIDSVHCVLNLKGKVELILPPTEPFRVFVYRLPQTRIYYSLYQNLDWRIKILDYFDRTIFLIQSLKGPQSVRFSFHNEKAILTPLTGASQGKDDWLVEYDAFGIFPEEGQTIKETEAGILPYLQSIREHEYKQHILNTFLTSDHGVRQKIDQLFTQVNEIDSFGSLQISSVQTSAFIWLHELYLQLGWLKRLNDFYAQIDPKQLKRSIVLNFTARRFNDFAGKIGSKFPTVKLPAVKKGEKSNTFLERYLLPEDGDEALDADLQDFWEYLQVPALRLRWQREIERRPDEFVAFVLLSICRKFWWAPMAVDFVKPLLPDSYHKVFDLLAAVMLRICVAPTDFGFKISSLQQTQTERRIVSDYWDIKYYTFGKQAYSNAIFTDFSNLTVNLNQWVDFKADSQNRIIYLQPSLFRPPVNLPSWRTVEIEFLENKIVFPLIWEQVTLKLNNCRLKFLRKKNRFQITVKNPNPQNRLSINGKIVALRDDRYARIYLPIKKTESKTVIAAYSLSGGRLKALPPEMNALTLRGIAYDVFGILKEEFRVRFNNSRRNHGIKVNRLTADVLNVPTSPVTMTVTCRKCSPTEIVLNKENSFWHAFKTIPAERLVNELKIWVENGAKIEADALAKLVSERLGWLPEIEFTDLKNFRPEIAGFNLLISSEIKRTHEKTNQIGIINIFRTNKPPKIKYLQIDSENWRNIFDFYFFIQDIAKN